MWIGAMRFFLSKSKKKEEGRERQQQGKHFNVTFGLCTQKMMIIIIFILKIHTIHFYFVILLIFLFVHLLYNWNFFFFQAGAHVGHETHSYACMNILIGRKVLFKILKCWGSLFTQALKSFDYSRTFILKPYKN